jgi:hypothetical protein
MPPPAQASIIEPAASRTAVDVLRDDRAGLEEMFGEVFRPLAGCGTSIR